VTAAEWAASGCCWASLVPSGLRWLRVSQREHYLPGAVSTFAIRWWVRARWNAPLALLALTALALAWPFPLVAVGTAAVAAAGPIGLSVRGRTSPLAWTRRLRTLAGLWLLLEAGIIAVGVAVARPPFFAAVAVAVVPPVLDLACLALLPFERWVGSRYVDRASARLRSVAPRIVAITGSFGKTSTKNYVTHLLAGHLPLIASPASFNNRAGLARAVNEHLVPGTQVFVAEMGTYGKGEIAELCRWCPPEIAVVTAIGPVHLERFGSEERILEAKSEITAGARAVVLNVDDRRLADLADRLSQREQAPTVLRCSAVDRSADICVAAVDDTFEVVSAGEPVRRGVALAAGIQPTNVACALGVCVALGLSVDDVAAQLATLPPVPHRLSLGTAASGVVVIDDTFNSNPAGTRAALGVLAATGHGRRVVVTPGMVELGPRQADENRAFAQASLEIASDLVVVGQTNRAAMSMDGDRTTTLRTRDEAVRWVREHLTSGDVVLYENDLPDHYP
jgi:UDP-N-acetylmuramoyl-tripeptide--D-alanyl-D-alanine ligase